MSEIYFVRGARQLLTLRGPAEPRRGPAFGALGIIRDGALLIENGRILEVGLTRRIENLTQAQRAQEIDVTGRVVMPGFVDCHTHLVWGLPWLDDFEASIAGAHGEAVRGPASTMAVMRNSSVKRLAARTRQFLNGMVRHGTTTLEGNTGHGLDSSLKILRVQAKLHQSPLDIVSTFISAGATPAGHENWSAEYTSWMCSELLPSLQRRALARFVGLRCEEGLDREQGLRYLWAARSLGFQIKIHSSQDHAGESVRMAVEMGAASVDNLDHPTPAEVDRLADSNTVAVVLPGATFHRTHENAAARAVIDGGAAVALATNFNPGTSPTYNMQMMVALACARLKMSPAEAICAATFNAACAIRAGRTAGSLEAGKFADFVVLNASDYREIPYHFGVNLVNRTVKRGVTIYLEGKVGQQTSFT